MPKKNGNQSGTVQDLLQVLDLNKGSGKSPTSQNTPNENELTGILPSEVTTEKYISIPPIAEGSFACETMQQGGKWMVFLNGNLQLLDPYWKALTPLYHNGTVSMVRATTSLDLEGLISCYTPDANNVDEIRKAGDEIRRRTGYDRLMYYKTNQSTVEGRFLNDGCRYVSKYMHTVSCGLYQKDRLQRWIMVPRS